MKKIIVTGGSGLVGSELKKILNEALYPSSSEMNLIDPKSISNYLKKNKPTHIVHLAAYVGSLHDNIKNRCKYFDENIIMNTLITKISADLGINNFLGILSTCIYPDTNNNFPLRESCLHEGKPHESLMSYAYAKRAHSVQLDNYRETYGYNYQYLIPCNMYGFPNKKNKKRQHFINDLIQKIVIAKNNNEDLVLFGDGTPLRQFMHARDFAKIISLYINNDKNFSSNVAPDINLSINDYAQFALKLFNLNHINIKYDHSLPNGQFRKDVSTSIFNKHFPEFVFSDLATGFQELYDFYSLQL